MTIFATNHVRNKRKLAILEAEKRHGRSKTYTEPIPNEDLYMITFYRETIFEKALEIKDIISKYPDTVGEHYSVLVPNTVSYACFWARYFYRCCVDSIIQEWIQLEEDRNIQLQCQRSAVLLPIESRHLRESIERGLGARPPEQVIESTGKSFGASPRHSVNVSMTSSPSNKCRKSTSAPQCQSETMTPPRSSTPDSPDMGENDPYYMAIFHLVGNSTAQLQQNMGNINLEDGNESNGITPVKATPKARSLFSSEKKPIRKSTSEDDKIMEILQV